MLLDQDEASRLVEATRWIVRDDAEAQGAVSLSNAGLDEFQEGVVVQSPYSDGRR